MSTPVAVPPVIARVMARRGVPRAVIVTGSGLGALVESLDGREEIRFTSIEGLPGTTVGGHPGAFAFGTLESVPVLVQAGRFHRYEGVAPDDVALPLRIANAAGIRVAILTNATGGIGDDATPGTVVVLEGQIAPGLQPPGPEPRSVREAGRDLIRGASPRALFDRELSSMALEAGRSLAVPVTSGVYGGTLGPSFETPAEIRMLGRLGASVVGMSTIDEAAWGHSLGMRVLGLSLVTNRAAGLSGSPLDHLEVLEGGRKGAGAVEAVIRRVLRRLALDG